MKSRRSFNRRDFLATASAAAAWASLDGAFSCLGAAAPAPPLAVFSKVYQELHLTFEQAAEVTAAAGLDGIDCAVRSGGEIEPERAAGGQGHPLRILSGRGRVRLHSPPAVRTLAHPTLCLPQHPRVVSRGCGPDVPAPVLPPPSFRPLPPGVSIYVSTRSGTPEYVRVPYATGTDRQTDVFYAYEPK